jgi:hypothetical protein
MQDRCSRFPRNTPRRHIFAAVVLGLLGLPAFAAPTAAARTSIDWVEGIYHLSISVTLEEDIYYLPVARRNAEAYVQDRLPFLVLESLAEFPVSSSQVLRDYTDADPVLRGEVRDLSFQLVRSVLSEDLATLNLEYRLPIYPDLAHLFIQHETAVPLEPQLGWVPGDEHTGLVIYAATPLPWWGEEEERVVMPTLFPRLLDESGRVIFSKEHVAPDILVDQGIVAYSQDVSEAGFGARVGSYPLRCLATATFGTESTDLVLPADVVDLLFTREENLEILAQGRILVILPPMPTSP